MKESERSARKSNFLNEFMRDNMTKNLGFQKQAQTSMNIHVKT